MNETLKRGMVVTIYEDPVTRKRPEGKARLVRLVQPLHDGAIWHVQFLGDATGDEVRRIICTEGT